VGSDRACWHVIVGRPDHWNGRGGWSTSDRIP